MKAPFLLPLVIFHSMASSSSSTFALRSSTTPAAFANDGPRRTPTLAPPRPSSSLSASSAAAASAAAAAVMADVESRAACAIETWSVEATPFMEPECADAIERMLAARADVAAFRIVGGRRRCAPPGGGGSSSASSGEGRRSRFVLVHPDLGLDSGTAEIQHTAVVRVRNVDLDSSNTVPNALASIGVHLDDVGDVVVSSPSTVHLVVDPGVVGPCLRLLSKELRGVGIDLALCEQNEFMPHGTMQEMKLSRSLERRMGRKKYEGGFVRFG
jgi:RNA-binding protein YlmH